MQLPLVEEKAMVFLLWFVPALSPSSEEKKVQFFQLSFDCSRVEGKWTHAAQLLIKDVLYF